MAKFACLIVFGCLGAAVRSQYGEREGPNLSHLYRHNLAASGQLAARFGALRRVQDAAGGHGAGSHPVARTGSTYLAPGQQGAHHGYATGNSRTTYGSGPGYSPRPREEQEPANYEFSYEVAEPEHRLDFGHEEIREGELTEGKYYVVLPDGRKQVVSYRADKGGYRPTVSYEENYNAQNIGYGAQNNGQAQHSTSGNY